MLNFKLLVFKTKDLDLCFISVVYVECNFEEIKDYGDVSKVNDRICCFFAC